MQGPALDLFQHTTQLPRLLFRFPNFRIPEQSKPYKPFDSAVSVNCALGPQVSHNTSLSSSPAPVVGESGKDRDYFSGELC